MWGGHGGNQGKGRSLNQGTAEQEPEGLEWVSQSSRPLPVTESSWAEGPL